MNDDARIAFAVSKLEQQPALEVRVNFGIFAGREATPAEIDELAKALLPAVPNVSIIAEERHEISEDSEVSLHQVRIEIAGDDMPTDEPAIEELSERLVAEAQRWAHACVADRHAEISEL